MITDTLALKLEYESTRMSRYQGFYPCHHTQEELDTAYAEWANAVMGRENEWDAYCDVRDGYPIGTNRKIRKRREKAKRIVYVQ